MSTFVRTLIVGLSNVVFKKKKTCFLNFKNHEFAGCSGIWQQNFDTISALNSNEDGHFPK